MKKSFMLVAKLFKQPYLNKIIICILLIVLIVISYIFLFNNSQKHSFDDGNPMSAGNLNFEVPINNVHSQQQFETLCNEILNTKYNFKLLNPVNETVPKRTNVAFTKTFKRNFLQRIFGPKKVVYAGTIIGIFVNDSTYNIKHESEWRKFYNDEKYDKVNDGDFNYEVDIFSIAQDIRNWKPKLN